MTDFDLERLGDVWRQQPDPAEMERLQRSAAKVSRRARWTQLLDIVVAVAVAGIVLLLVFSNPQRETVLVGSAAIFIVLYGNIRQRRLRQLELRSLTGTSEQMLDQSIERLEARMKHNRFALIAIGPALVIGVLLAASAGVSEGDLLDTVRSSPMMRGLLGKGAIAVVAGMIVYALFDLRRARSELERLKTMRDSYREERNSSAS